MRIISGEKRGLKLFSPAEDAPIRPTADRVKEAIFNIIDYDIYDCAFLDLFAGTGQMGIEAISRGARRVMFVDNNPDSVALTKKNIKKAGFIAEGRFSSDVFFGDYKKFLKTTTEKFDIIFIDPPYERGLTEKALEVLGSEISCLAKGGKAVIECNFEENIPETVGSLQLVDRRKYGIASVLIYKRPEESNE